MWNLGWGDRLGPACCSFPWVSLGPCTFVGILVPAAWGEGEGGKFGHKHCAPDEFREKDQVGLKAEAVLTAKDFLRSDGGGGLGSRCLWLRDCVC